MAVGVPWVTVDPNFAYQSDGTTLCGDGDDVYFVTDVAGNGATIVPDPTNRPKVAVLGGEKFFYFPIGITSFFTVTLPAARQYDDISHVIAYEPPSVTVNNTFYGLFASTVTTAGQQMRCTIYSSAGQTAGTPATGGVIACNDGAARVLNYHASGQYTYGLYGSLHVRNLLSLRYGGGPTLNGYINQSVVESSTAGGTASGNLTAFFLGKHNTTAANFAGGYVAIWHIYDSALSQTDAGDTFDAVRADYPFFVDVDWDKFVLIGIGDSTMHGYYTTTDRTWHRKGLATDAGTNFPDGQPQYLIMGHPGVGFITMNEPVWEEVIAPEVPANPGRLVLYSRGAVNAIRTESATAAQCYTACKAAYDSFRASVPGGIFITDTTGPRTSGNVALEAYDVLIKAQFVASGLGANIYRGAGVDFDTNCYLVDYRANVNIGLDGDDTTGTQANWANDAPDGGVTPNNTHYFYHSDATHHIGTDAANPGQTEFLNELLPLLQFLAIEIVPPTVTSGAVAASGLQTVLTLSEDCDYPTPLTADWEILSDGAPVAISDVELTNPTTITFDHAQIYDDAVVVFSYVGGTGKVEDLNGNAMEAINDQSIDNDSTVPFPTPGGGGGSRIASSGLSNINKGFIYSGTRIF
jgi:hypothetical protein